ncbi:MAG: D-tyrosyl-tRNA(Tyr) deacylase [Flavobacteriales bacterium]|jgi:D-tyrosyl-tRNA(Tyr) deacylase
MRVVLQRVLHTTVSVDEEIVGIIGSGYLLLLGVEEDDTEEDRDWLVRKIIGMRIFNDSDGKMNLSINEVNGEILVVSQFTLFASVKKGNRPSFIKAANPEFAEEMYVSFSNSILDELDSGIVQNGVFGADMQVEILNDGPVTILLDSKNRE